MPRAELVTWGKDAEGGKRQGVGTGLVLLWGGRGPEEAKGMPGSPLLHPQVLPPPTPHRGPGDGGLIFSQLLC